jgi:hypothetical protein
MAESETALQAVVHEKGIDIKSFPWYHDDISSLSDSARKLLEGYSKIPGDEVVGHVKAVVSAPLPTESMINCSRGALVYSAIARSRL